MQFSDAAVHRMTDLMLGLVRKLASGERIIPIAASPFAIGVGIDDRRCPRLSKDTLGACGDAKGVVLCKARGEPAKVGGNDANDAVAQIDDCLLYTSRCV